MDINLIFYLCQCHDLNLASPIFYSYTIIPCNHHHYGLQSSYSSLHTSTTRGIGEPAHIVGLVFSLRRFNKIAQPQLDFLGISERFERMVCPNVRCTHIATMASQGGRFHEYLRTCSCRIVSDFGFFCPLCNCGRHSFHKSLLPFAPSAACSNLYASARRLVFVG